MLIGASLKEIHCHKKRKTVITRKNPKFSAKFQKIRKVKSPNQKNPKAGKTSAFRPPCTRLCVCVQKSKLSTSLKACTAISTEFLSGVIGRTLPSTSGTKSFWHVHNFGAGTWLKVAWQIEALHRISMREWMASHLRPDRREWNIAGRLLGLVMLEAASRCKQNTHDDCNDYAYQCAVVATGTLFDVLDFYSCRSWSRVGV